MAGGAADTVGGSDASLTVSVSLTKFAFPKS